MSSKIHNGALTGMAAIELASQGLARLRRASRRAVSGSRGEEEEEEEEDGPCLAVAAAQAVPL